MKPELWVEAVGCYGQEMNVHVPASRRKIRRHQAGHYGPIAPLVGPVSWISAESKRIRDETLVGCCYTCEGDWPWIAEQLIAEGLL